MVSKSPLKQGEEILFGVAAVFMVMAVIGYSALEMVRHRSSKPIYANLTHFDLTPEGRRGSMLFRKSRCTSCHSAMRNGTNMGLSLDGDGSRRTKDWLFNFLRDPETTYGAVTFDHGSSPKEAAYVAALPVQDLEAMATFISELKAEQGSSASPVPPEGRSEFIDNMVKIFAPPAWKEKYRDVRDKSPGGVQQDKGVQR